MRRIKLFLKRCILILPICFLASMGLLFGTDYGYELRIMVTERLQHSEFAKYTFLPMEKSDNLLDEIETPA